MPKMFPITLEVEEIALGRVMRLLHNTPGVAKLHFDLGDTKQRKTNGHRKPKGSFEESGADLLIRVLNKSGPMSKGQMHEAFEKAGRSGKSADSVTHGLKSQGLIQNTGNGYVLTKKMRDRLRHRKGA